MNKNNNTAVLQAAVNECTSERAFPFRGHYLVKLKEAIAIANVPHGVYNIYFTGEGYDGKCLVDTTIAEKIGRMVTPQTCEIDKEYRRSLSLPFFIEEKIKEIDTVEEKSFYMRVTFK